MLRNEYSWEESIGFCSDAFPHHRACAWPSRLWFSKLVLALSVAGHSLEVRNRQQDSIKTRFRVGGKQLRKHPVLFCLICFFILSFSFYRPLSLPG